MAENGSNVSRMRNAKACEACRASKSRCFFRNQQSICQRCEQSGNHCIVRTKARPMRTKASRQGHESALDQLSRAAGPEFSISLPTVTAPDSGADVAELYRHHEGIFLGEEGDNHQDDETGDHSRARMPIIGQRKIDQQKAEDLLHTFLIQAPFFPFVHIPPNATIPCMSSKTPFLLLAILTVASSRDPRLYHQMDQEFRRILSLKVIVEGKKSLDFLQGMLIYIAWYPMHLKPKNNQAFIYMNLAISIAIDLGLEQEYPNMNVFGSISSQGLIEDSLFTTPARRAYLGCYYLSSSLSMGFQKPNNLHYRNLMNDQGEALLQHENQGNFTSGDIISLIKLQHLTERIGEVHKHSIVQARGELEDGSLLTEMNIQMFLNELQEWRTTTSAEIQNLPFVGLADRFANITVYSHGLGFLRRPYRDVLKSTKIPANRSHLFSCLDACKRFFEHLVSIPESNYSSFTTAQWASIVQSILVLSRLTFLMASNLDWTPETTRTNIPLVMYLEALSYRFQAVSSTTPPSASERVRDPDVFYVLTLILGSVRKSYSRRVAAITPSSIPAEPGQAAGGARGHCPMLDPSLAVYFDSDLEVQMGDSSYGSSGGPASGSTPSSDPSALREVEVENIFGSNSANAQVGTATPVYFDLWATMTGSWAAD